jgi:hypothetical protein
VASLTLKSKTMLKIIAREKHASLFYLTGFEENYFFNIDLHYEGKEVTRKWPALPSN